MNPPPPALPVIPRGQAVATIDEALVQLEIAMARVAALAHACARALDQTAATVPPPQQP